MALTDNLISYWKSDESSGNLLDAHGSNNLTDNNTVQADASGIINGARLYNGTNECFSITDASQSGLDITGDWSVSFWIKVGTQPALDTSFSILDKRKIATNGQYTIFYRNPNTVNKEIIRMIFRDSSDNQTSFINANDLGLNTGTWYHIVVTVDVSVPSAVMYLNAVSQTFNSDGTAATSIGNSDGPFFIGDAIAAGTVPYNGSLDEFGIWSRILTSDEVTQLYNGGAGLSYDDFDGGAGQLIIGF